MQITILFSNLGPEKKLSEKHKCLIRLLVLNLVFILKENKRSKASCKQQLFRSLFSFGKWIFLCDLEVSFHSSLSDMTLVLGSKRVSLGNGHQNKTQKLSVAPNVFKSRKHRKCTMHAHYRERQPRSILNACKRVTVVKYLSVRRRKTNKKRNEVTFIRRAVGLHLKCYLLPWLVCVTNSFHMSKHLRWCSYFRVSLLEVFSVLSTQIHY